MKIGGLVLMLTAGSKRTFSPVPISAPGLGTMGVEDIEMAMGLGGGMGIGLPGGGRYGPGGNSNPNGPGGPSGNFNPNGPNNPNSNNPSSGNPSKTTNNTDPT